MLVEKVHCFACLVVWSVFSIFKIYSFAEKVLSTPSVTSSAKSPFCSLASVLGWMEKEAVTWQELQAPLVDSPEGQMGSTGSTGRQPARWFLGRHFEPLEGARRVRSRKKRVFISIYF